MSTAHGAGGPSQQRRTRRTVLGVGAGAGLLAIVVGGVLSSDVLTPGSQAPWSSEQLTTARRALEGPATISVIGDSTGNDGNEWVALWAQYLGASRRVVLHQWLNNNWKPGQLTFGDLGDELQIWNAGQPGAPADWAVDQMASVQPYRPDLVLVSAGHNNTADDIGGRLDQLMVAINSRWGSAPAVLILQNPGQGLHRQRQELTRGAAFAWAQRSQVPTIDVAPAFDDPDAQLRDDVHPNEVGSRSWADAVAAALS